MLIIFGVACVALAGLSGAKVETDRRFPVCFRNEHDRMAKNLAKVIAHPKEFLKGPEAQKKEAEKHFVIVGAGIAGILSSYLLIEAGHKVTMLESSSRIGGRIYTHYGDGYYADIGAMRFPPFHIVVHEVLKHFDVEFANFTNKHEGNSSYIFVDGKYYPSHDIIGNHSREESVRELYNLYKISKIPTDDQGKIVSPYDIVQTYLTREVYTADHCTNDQTLSSFLRDKLRADNLDENLAFLWSIIAGTGPLMSGSLDEFITDSDGKELKRDNRGSFVEIKNGASVMVQKVFEKLSSNPNFQLKSQSRVTKVIQKNITRGVEMPVTVVYESIKPGTDIPVEEFVEGNYAILTPTMRAMEMILFQPNLDYKKRNAFEKIHYVDAIKIFLKFKEPFWSYGPEKGNRAVPIEFGPHTSGAVGITDGRTHQIYYPSHDFHGPVLIGSYTWEDNANFFSSLTEDESVQLALDELVKIHGNIVKDYFQEGFIYFWAKNRHSRAAFIHQFPNEKYAFIDSIQKDEGNLIFSGEYANKDFPGWVEASVQSAIRNLVNLWPEVYDNKFGAEEKGYLNRAGRTK